MKRLVIGVLAHVDSGKTTLSEGLLYCAGHIKNLGRVDHGNAFLDSYSLEKERGITIFSKQAVFEHKSMSVTLLDTPGHIDFSTEMERALETLDYAILVISGTDGVQSHTETLWRLLKHHNIPTFIFINKMDLPGAHQGDIMAQLKSRISDGCIDLFAPSFQENAAMCHEHMLEQFLSVGSVSADKIAVAIAEQKLLPCCFGAALKLEGVSDFLNAIEKYTLAPVENPIFGGKIFKISRDDQGNRLTHMKITGGKLQVRDLLQGTSRGGVQWSEKVNQIRIYSGAKFQVADTAQAGTVCAVTGLGATLPGDGLGCEQNATAPILEPVLTCQVHLPADMDPHTALVRLRLLEEEDPQLRITWNKSQQQISAQIMGQVQLEILKSLILERFAMDISFGNASTVYKETISSPVLGVGHFEPLRHYAEVHLLLEPAPRGSGLSFCSICSEDVLDKNWQKLVLTHLQEKSHVGVLTGSPITDVKITLLTGRGHLKHTEGGDFREATYRAIRHALRTGDSVLLEPWYDLRLELPTESVGRAMTDLQRMGGSFSTPITTGEMSYLTGSAPVNALAEYPLELSSYTHGRGRLSLSLKGYEPCQNQEQIITEIGYNCDSDIENTADSVFCTHGAGFVVNWKEAASHMHVESVYSLEKENDTAILEPKIRRQAASYCATLAQDKELLAIFERTYGPVKRKERLALESVRRSTAPSPEVVTAPPNISPIEPEYLLVDGYNIIFAWEDLSALAHENLDAARTRLCNILRNYQGFRKCELILVFDAYKVKGNIGTVEKLGGISVVYTKEAETADMYIEKVTHRLGNLRRVRVATSDVTEQIIIVSHGAQRVSALMFRREVDLVEQSIREILEK